MGFCKARFRKEAPRGSKESILARRRRRQDKLQESLFQGAVSESDKQKIASVVRDCIDGPFLRIDDHDAHLEARTQAIKHRLAKGIRSDGSDARNILYVFEASRDIPERIRDQQRI